VSLQGQIEETGLGPIIQTLSLNRYRGTLRIETEANSQFFFISEGEIVLVRQVKRDPVRLGDLLVSAGHLTEEQLESALNEQRKSGRIKRLGKTLVDLGLVDEDKIEQAVRDKFEEDFLDLFLLDRGRFEFIFGLTPEALFGPDERLERITLHTSSLMMEAMRRVDEWQQMIRDLGNFDTMFRNRLQSQATAIEDYEFEGVTLTRQTRADIYLLLDGTRSLREVIASALETGVATRLQTFLFLHALQSNNLIRPLDFKALLSSAKDALGSGNVAGAAKFIRAILGRKEAIDLGLVNRYLRFLEDQQRPRLAFDEACRFAARCLAEDDTDSAITLYEAALALYTTVVVIDRLFYALLRANKRERAVEVGLFLRDHLQSEGDLGVAQRIAQNLQEFAGDDPGVIEFKGLILKRRERNEEAVVVLDEALAKYPAEHPRRASLIAALRELVPDREDLRDAQADLELQEARRQVVRERKLRWIGIGVTMIVLLILWRGYAEWRSRALLSEARRVLSAAKENDPTALRRAEVLLGGVQDLTLVGGEASELAKEVGDKAGKLELATKERVDELIRRQQLEAKEAAAARERAKDREALSAALAGFQATLSERDHEGASSQALQIAAKWPKVDDPELAREASRLRVYSRIVSQPTGASVLAGDKVLGSTPCEVGVPLGKTLTIRLRRPGYHTLPLELSSAKRGLEEVTLTPGATWGVELTPQALDPAPSSRGPLVGERSGEVRLLDLADGSERWKTDSPGTGALTGLAVCRNLGVVIRGRSVSGLTLATGEIEWTQELKGQGPLLGPAFGQALGQDVIVLASGRQLILLDLSTGSLVLEVGGLPAPAKLRATTLGDWGYLPLTDRVIGFSLTQAGKRSQGWKDLNKKARWERPVVASAPLVAVPAVQALVAQLAKGELRVLDRATGVTTPIAPSMGPLVGLAESRGLIFCLGESGQLASYRSDGLEVMAPKPVLPAATGGPILLGKDLLCVDRSGMIVRFSLAGRRRADPSPIKLGQGLKYPVVPVGEGVLIRTDDRLRFIEPQDQDN
jgi:uncharacterized protein DUF4388/putative pyrroloquinoline-quinone binding quinoprotein/PEGA domain-containing protein